MKDLLLSASAGIIFSHRIDEFLHVFPKFHSYTTKKKKKSTLMKSALDSDQAVFFSFQSSSSNIQGLKEPFSYH